MNRARGSGPARPQETAGATVVRGATADDAAGIQALPGLSNSTLRSLDRDLATARSSEPRAPVVLVAVAASGGAAADEPIVGAAFGLLQFDEGHVLDLAVAPQHRRGGVGGALLAALDAALRGRGAVALTLEVREGNLGAQALYRRLGFTAEGGRPGYYPDGEDALLMWRRAAVDHGGG